MSKAKKIAVLVGSLRKESINRKLAKAVEKLAGDRLQFDYVEIADLALYNQDKDDNYPANWTAMKEKIKSSDAVLLVTPEYNRSIPGVLKNALDIASRPYGTNAFAGKKAAIIGASPGAPGTSMSQQHLRNVMLYLDTQLLGQPEVYLQFKDGLVDEDGKITNEGTEKFLSSFVDKYIAWIS